MSSRWRAADATTRTAARNFRRGMAIAAAWALVLALPSTTDSATGTSTTGVPYTQIPGLFAGEPRAINSEGAVVGLAAFEEDGPWHAFWWDGESGHLDITPDAASDGESIAHDLNDGGEVVGEFRDAETLLGRGFRWTLAGGGADIGNPPGFVPESGSIEVDGIDEAGNIAVSYCTDDETTCGFYGTAGMTGPDLTPIGLTPAGGRFDPDDVDLYDEVNGIVLGSALEGGVWRIYTWTPAGVRGEQFVPLQDSISSTRRIKAGMIAGGVDTPDGMRAAYWTSPDAAPTVLDTLGGGYSLAASINSFGWVVGQSETAGGEAHAFLWTPETGMSDLGTLGGMVSWAVDINDAGQIAGVAENTAGEPLTIVWEPDLSPGGGDPIEITIAEAIAVADDVAVSGAALLISVQEEVGVADTVALRPPVLISVAESVSVSDEVLLTGPVTILVLESVAVADNVSVVMIGGDDGDGIDAPVDGAMVGGAFTDESGVFSDRFTDQHVGGVTLGTIVDRGALEVAILDAPSALDGVTVDTSAGPGTAAVAFCPANHLLTFAPSTSATVTCGSITIAVEAGEVTLALPNGELRIPAGATVTVTQDGSTTTVENHADSEASALLIVGGVEISVPPGDSVPLASGCLGDVNGDGIISLLDGLLVFRALWSRPGDRRWNPAADLNNDDRVTLIDLAIVGASLLEPSCRSRWVNRGQ